MLTNFEKVAQFMRAFKQPVTNKPHLPAMDLQILRIELIDEEFKELTDAFLQQDLLGIADALTDLLYVIYGAGHSYGINLDQCLEEVHSSNMTKLGEGGMPIYREDGKVLKGPNYRPPDLSRFV